ncbi:hypothetical protein HYH03_014052 [Edaphochlamys debaryana]|uniref:Uncharacterized protein n=1 Tax=Edaphochlamys debaryana TaxID=47281 RepID=A0A835XNW0_9CHLO|nr:hypothetical protein HYH03_014052 [Edaphochlamys debaryana]|eukprot:KAG2487336.1 hypothetical protein HYH03_014052 [Edaphochlamys debaryana]
MMGSGGWPSLLPSSASGGLAGLAPAVGPLATPAASRSYHAWYYGSKLRNRTILGLQSLDELEELLVREGDRLDHVNLTVLLKRIQQLGAAEEAAAAAASTADPADGAAGAGDADAAPSATAAAVSAAAARAVRGQVVALAAEACRLVRKRAKWYDPRYAAMVVARTAALGHTDGRLLHVLTGRVVDRLNEAYSRDLLLLLRGLRAHQLASAAAAASLPGGQRPAALRSPEEGRRGPRPPAAPLPYDGPPVVLLDGVRAFLAGKVPTGRMPPECLQGLLRHVRLLGGQPLGPGLCALAEADLRRRLPVYAPTPLAGLLATLAAEGHPLPTDLLASAAAQFEAHAHDRGTGAAAAALLSSTAAALRRAGAAAADGSGGTGGGAAQGLQGPGAWLAERPELLAACLQLLQRDLPAATPGQLASWIQALALAEAPLAAPPAAATEAAAGFVSAHAAAVAATLPVRQIASGSGSGTAPGSAAGTESGTGSPVAAKIRAAYGKLQLPAPPGL